MKKAMAVLLCLWLGVSIVMLISLTGQKNVLHDDWQSAVRKNEVLQTLHDQAKKEWEEKRTALEEKNTALTEENEELKQETADLNQELEAAKKEALNLADAEKQAAEALAQAKQAWEDEKKALTAEKDAASGRLSEVLAFLLTPEPESMESPAPEDQTDDLFAPTDALPDETAMPSPRTILEKLLPMK